jgi:DNA-binding NarL/FixJ family response regulator
MASPVNSRVLIVVSEPITRFGLLQLIKDQKNLCACGDADCLTMAREWCEKEKPEVVIIDPAMGDGFGFIRDMRKWCPQTRLVVFTALEDALSVQRAFKAGVSAYVTRRDSLNALISAVEGAVRNERHMSPRVEHVMLTTLACGELELRGNVEADLSNREREVLRLLGHGQSTREIAIELHVSVKTVETHSLRIKEKLNLKGSAALRRHAALYASTNGNGRTEPTIA